MGREDTGGPFTHYPANPKQIALRAADLLRSAQRIARVGDQAYAGGRRAIAATHGDFVALFDVRLRELRERTLRLKRAAVVASGALSTWASSIVTYDAGIDELNTEYALARQGAGLGPLLLANLTARQTRLAAELEDDARRVSGLLTRSPSETTVQRLLERGALPLRVTTVLSEYDFSDVDASALVRSLRSRGELPSEVDPGSVERAVRLLERLTDPEQLPLAWSRPVLTMAWDRLAELDPRAVDLVVLGLSDEQLTTLDRMVSRTGPRALPLPMGAEPFGLDRFDLVDFHTLFLAHASVDTLHRLQRTWRSIEPAVRQVDSVEDGSMDRPRWRRQDTGDLFADAPITGDDIDQGGVGDCWMLAKLAALAESDPDWVREHVRRNDNGTVSVTFYDDSGAPHEVTVTDKQPVDDDGRQVFSGNDGTGDRWADYYEKAFALASDHGHDDGPGYGGIESGRASDGARLMTGNEAEAVEDIREHVDAGEPVVVGTSGDDLSEPFVPNHQFYVEGFTSDGDVILGNPWGSDEPDLVLTAGEFNDLIDDAAVIKP